LFRFVAIGAVLAALALGACGRKGPLELPPGAAMSDPAGNPPKLGPDGQPVTAAPQPPPKKNFPLDPLID
jgi:predicted small lipoprotein YifL